ncbi:hypothetical protein ACIXNK_12580 [Bacteroides fragilis]
MRGRQILRKNDRYCDDDFTIFMIIRIGYLRIGLLTPHHVRMIGLFSFVTHRYCIAEYRKVLEGDRDMLIRYPLFPSNDFSLRF